MGHVCNLCRSSAGAVINFHVVVITLNSVFEIKGAPCTRCAQFGCRVHRFWYLCTRWVHLISEYFYTLYRSEHMEISLGARF